MTYNSLFNDPYERSRVTYPYVGWNGGFTDDELKRMEEYFATKELNTAKVMDEQITDSRDSLIHFEYRSENSAWIFEKFNALLWAINSAYYNFDLNGYSHLQYTEYHATTSGRYDWHMDSIMSRDIPNHSDTRKLSLSLVLNDGFEGGDFQFNLGREEKCETADLPKGRIIAFPSFMIHRVMPVTKGVRKSLVIWVEGPKFR